MNKTTVKTLTGDIFSVEHESGRLETGLKEAINKYYPEFYSECQNIVYPDEEDKSNCYVILDNLADVIEITLEKIILLHV